MDELPCSKIVYRAILRKPYIDPVNKKVLPAAFFRREPPNDNDGLSVGTSTPEKCASGFNSCYGVGSLHVGKIRDLGLDVVPDEEHHANIKGVPRKSDDTASAERFASLLARQTRLLDITHFAKSEKPPSTT